MMQLLSRRLQQHAATKNVRYTQAIINHGREAGASLAHPHGQLLGLPFVPGELLDEQRAFTRFEGGCILCATVEAELVDGKRVVQKVQGDTLAFTEVVEGLSDGGRVQVVKGLAAGDIVKACVGAGTISGASGRLIVSEIENALAGEIITVDSETTDAHAFSWTFQPMKGGGTVVLVSNSPRPGAPVTRQLDGSHTGLAPMRAIACAMSSPPVRMFAVPQTESTSERGQAPCSWRWRSSRMAADFHPKAQAVGVGTARVSTE